MKLKEITQHWTMIQNTKDNSNSFLRSSWFSAWQIYIKEKNNWRGNINYTCGNYTNGCVLLPLAKQIVGPFNFTSLAGNFFPHRGFPFSGEPNLAALAVVEKLSKLNVKSGFRAGPILLDEKFNAALLSHLKKFGWKVSINDLGYTYRLKLPNEKDDFLGTLTTKRKKKLRYYWNSINKKGTTSIIHSTGLSEADWSKVFVDLTIIESDAWVSDKGEPRFIGKNNLFFWNDIVRDSWFKNALNVWILYLNSIPVSYTIALDSGNTRHILANSYSESVSEYSTGSKLYTEMILEAIDSKVDHIDFGFGDSGYKRKWGAEPYKKVAEIYAFPRTVEGTTTCFIFNMKNKLDKLISRSRK